jgi:cytoskeleton protein RodZ
MINQPMQSNTASHKHAPFSLRLKTAREALGMDRQEAAAQLRLPEQTIIMLETGEIKPDLPLTFLRGYIRNYGKLLNIPEDEIIDALAYLQPKSGPEEGPAHSAAPIHPPLIASSNDMTLGANIGNFFVKFFTYLIAMTLLALVGIWWHSHKMHQTTSTTTIFGVPATVPADTTTCPPKRQWSLRK